MARVFISHTSADLPVAVEVRGWLRAEGHEVFLDRDLGDGLRVGEVWKQQLYAELRSADVVVCLVSAAFVDSAWCAAEVGIADCLGCRLIPIHLDGSPAHPLMEALQYADYHTDQQRARADLVAAVRRVDTQGGRWREGQNPYPGLEAFTAERASMFFGRERETRRLVDQVRSAAAAEQGWTVVVGPSGCGKSSLLRAGVCPVLAADPGWLVLPPLMPGIDPVAALARVLATGGIRAGLPWSVDTARDRLDRQEEGLRRLVDDLLSASPGSEVRRVLLPVDQAEELFTRADTAGVGRFTRLVAAATAGPVRVVAALRSEFLDDLRALSGLAGVGIGSYVLAPLGRDMLRLAVEQPARRAGLVLPAELSARLLADTGGGEALPLLAFTLHQLADGRSRGDTLSDRDYELLGGVHGALGRQADAALAAACTASGLPAEQILTRLAGLATLDDAGRYSRRRLPHDPTDTAWSAALGVFVDHRLLTTDTGEDGRWVAVAHEAFLTAWPPLAAALREHADRLRAYRSVEQAAAEWRQAGNADHYLWDAARLAATLTTGDGDPASGLSGDGRAFLTATRRHVAAARTRRRRRLTAAFTVLSVLLVAALAAAGVAVVQQRHARTAQAVALARSLTVQAGTAQATDPRLALQLALAAHHLDPGPETTSALITTVAATHQLPLGQPLTGHSRGVAPEPEVTSVVFSPDGRTLASSGGDGVRLWDVTDRTAPGPPSPPLAGSTGDWVHSVAFFPDGKTLASGGDSGMLGLWDVTERSAPRMLGQDPPGGIDGVFSVAFSPDGKTLASGGRDGVRLWDVADRTAPRPLGEPLTGHTGSVYSVAFSPDGKTLASGGGDNTVQLWDMTDRTAPRGLGEPLVGHTDQVFSVAFSPDGKTLASGGLDGTVRLWNVTDRTAPRSLGQPSTGHTGWVSSVAFSPDSKTLASGGGDNTVQLWDITDRTAPRGLGEPLVGHTDQVFSVAFSPDGKTLASGGLDGTVRLWNVTDRTAPRGLGEPLVGHTGGVFSVAFSPDGRTLASGNNAGTVRLWDVADRTAPGPPSPPFTDITGSWAHSVVYSPDGKTLASGDPNGTVRLWDVADRTAPRPLGQLLTDRIGGVFSVAFSPDGNTLASGGSDNTVRLWDMTDRAAPRPLGEPLVGHTSSVQSVVFAPDGRTLASGGDNTVRLWDVTDRSAPRPLGEPLTSHTGGVSSVVFSPDGRTLASADADQTVRLWDMTDRTAPRPLGEPLTGHTGGVFSMVFSPDGKTLASASADHTVRLWDLGPVAELQADPDRVACSLSRTGLTRSAWERYVPDFPYHDTCGNQ